MILAVLSITSALALPAESPETAPCIRPTRAGIQVQGEVRVCPEQRVHHCLVFILEQRARRVDQSAAGLHVIDEAGPGVMAIAEGAKVVVDGDRVFRQNGEGLVEIARETGRAASTVAYWVNKHGLVSRHASKHAARGGIERAELQALVEEGLSIRAIASRCWRTSR